MRSIWKGAISFGLVTIPVKLYSATEEKDIAFHQVHREDGGRIRYKRVCQIDGAEVAYSDIARGLEVPGDGTVVLTEDDLDKVPIATSRTIHVVQFVPLEQVDPIYFAKSYYLEPEKNGTKPYVLLREALEDSGQVAVVKVALRQREQLGTLRVRDGVFVLETMLWPDEIRTPDFGFLDDEVEVRPQELKMAGSLIESLSGDFDPTEYTDAYREALQQVIDAKIAGQEVVATPEAKADGGAVVDLMAALRASVEAAKAGRPGGKPAGEVTGAADRSSGKPQTATAGPRKPAAKPAPPGKAAKAAKGPGKPAKAAKTPGKAAKAPAGARAGKPARKSA